MPLIMPGQKAKETRALHFAWLKPPDRWLDSCGSVRVLEGHRIGRPQYEERGAPASVFSLTSISFDVMHSWALALTRFMAFPPPVKDSACCLHAAPLSTLPSRSLPGPDPLSRAHMLTSDYAVERFPLLGKNMTDRVRTLHRPYGGAWQHDISATLVHGVYDGLAVVYIYQLTSAPSNLGRFVIIDLSLSPSLFLRYLQLRQSVTSSLTTTTHSYVGLRLESSSILRTSTFERGIAFALHSRIWT
ncbi:hypothetical protein NA56DRAFT_710405 [Hyaloscypha hepaticicola]|uniref:Uncharacterized protein n=1 Tax=Hyaloscypha hepaticicola TaxID=2082293 RepID=A0A2J6PLR1_9HELO|nr:hypothetical protein NA56DRAFT_710405 [Hyaloscypha hepaticicola]